MSAPPGLAAVDGVAPQTLVVPTRHGEARAHLLHRDAGLRGAVVLGHGAGGGIDAPDLLAVAAVGLDLGLLMVLVEQPYRVLGRRVPPRAPTLDAAWEDVLDALRADALEGVPTVVGGRSSGGRVACRTSVTTTPSGVLCLAFPTRPPGKPDAPDRLGELDEVRVPVLVVQGRSDPFGIPPQAPGREVVLVDGDHALRRDLDAVRAAVGPWLERTLTL